MDEEQKPGSEGFKVTDRRRFDEEGKARDGAEAEQASPSSQAAPPPTEEPSRDARPPLTFSTFLLSIATSAHVHLGAIPNPGTGKTEVNLDAAREVIDLMALFQEKTRGNLTDDEIRLLEHLLYDLRMVFVQASTAVKTPGS